MAIEEVDQGIVEQLLPLLLSLLLLLFQLAAAAFHVRRRIAPRGDRQRQNEARTNERRSGMYIKTKTGINSSFSEFFFFFVELPLRGTLTSRLSRLPVSNSLSRFSISSPTR
jgi:hypothetical protein